MISEFFQQNEELSSDEEDHTPYLSDDDALDGDEDPDLLNSLRAGALPPEIRVLYSLFLMCLGGWNFVAEKCFDAIDHLEQEDQGWFSEHHLGSEVDDDSPWNMFRLAATEPMSRTVAYAFTADVLRKSGRDVEWGKKLASKFQSQIDALSADSNGIITELTTQDSGHSPLQRMRQNQVLKVLIASSYFQATHLFESDPGQEDAADRVQMAVSSVKRLASILHLFWKVEFDGTLTATSREVSFSLDYVMHGFFILNFSCLVGCKLILVHFS